MSTLANTHWPNRPEQPFWWYNEWGAGQAFARLDADPTRVCCISSIQLSSQADTTYFDLLLKQNGDTETVARILVPATSTVTVPYPTPLVVGSGAPWSISFGPIAVRGLFQATFVGFDVFPGPDQSVAAPEPRPKPSVPATDS